MHEHLSTAYYKIERDKTNNIIRMCFFGDIADARYKEVWERTFDLGVRHKVNRFLIDQTKIGQVSFAARGWVMLHMFPKIKKRLPENISGALLSSSNAVHRAGIQFLAKAFQRFSGYNVKFFDNEEEAISWLAKN